MEVYDCIALSETWLSECIYNSEIQLCKYNVVRCDRSLLTSNKTSGGGVLLAINKRYKFKVIPLSDSSFELILVQIDIGNTSVIIGVCYIVPNTDSSRYLQLVNCIQDSLNNAALNNMELKFCMLGDFNIPGYTWNIVNNKYSIAVGTHYNIQVRDAARIMSEWCEVFNLIQSNDVKNQSNNILDLVFSNFYDNNLFELSDEFIFKCDISHIPIICKLQIYMKCPKVSNELVFNFKNAHFGEIGSQIMEFKLPDIVDFNNFDRCIDDLDSLMKNLIGELVPSFLVKPNNFPRWFSSETKAAIVSKKKLHRLYKQHNSEYFYLKFKYERALCKVLINRDLNEFNSKTEQSLINNSTSFYSHIKQLSNKTVIPNVMHLHDTLAEDDSSIANLFADKFSSVYRNLDLSQTAVPFDYFDCCNGISFTETEIVGCIKKLDPYSSPGPDNIHPLIIINCCDAISGLLTIIFNYSVKLGIFPSNWKLSYINPTFKGGDVADILNYRPVNKYSVLAKMLDSLVYDKIIVYFKKFVTDKQHGFFADRSTVTNLCVYHDYLVNNLNKGLVVDAIYTDLTRAFDLVNVDLLLRKLQAYGLYGSLLKWFESFLTDRKQIVKIRNAKSYIIVVYSGVGQGTHLGPLLFLLFINDLDLSLLNCKFSLFADDAKFFKSITSVLDMIELQRNLSVFFNWCVENGLELNINKCKFIRFGKSSLPVYDYNINGICLERVNHVRDLGIIFDSKLTFKNHIETICIKANKKLYFIKRFSYKFKNLRTFRQIYFSYLYPLLSYGSVIWSPSSKGLIKDIESVNHKFLRFAANRTGYNMHFTDHNFTPIYSLFNIATLESSRNMADFLFGMKILLGLIDCIEIINNLNFYVPPRAFRQNRKIFEIPLLRQGNKSTISRKIQVSLNELLDWTDKFATSFMTMKKLSKVILSFE